MCLIKGAQEVTLSFRWHVNLPMHREESRLSYSILTPRAWQCFSRSLESRLWGSQQMGPQPQVPTQDLQDLGDAFDRSYGIGELSTALLLLPDLASTGIGSGCSVQVLELPLGVCVPAASIGSQNPAEDSARKGHSNSSPTLLAQGAVVPSGLEDKVGLTNPSASLSKSPSAEWGLTSEPQEDKVDDIITGSSERM